MYARLLQAIVVVAPNATGRLVLAPYQCRLRWFSTPFIFNFCSNYNYSFTAHVTLPLVLGQREVYVTGCCMKSK